MLPSRFRAAETGTLGVRSATVLKSAQRRGSSLPPHFTARAFATLRVQLEWRRRRRGRLTPSPEGAVPIHSTPRDREGPRRHWPAHRARWSEKVRC